MQDYPHINILIIVPNRITVMIIPTEFVVSSKKSSDMVFVLFEQK